MSTLSRSLVVVLLFSAFLGLWRWWPFVPYSPSRVFRDSPDLHQTTPAKKAPAGASNLVLVVGCTVRKDQTTLHNPELNTTPFLSRWAAEGTVFEDVITPAPWTRPSTAGILTGIAPTQQGLYEPESARSNWSLPPQVLTLSEVLRRSGYYTSAVVSNANLSSEFGFNQGFSQFLEPVRGWSRNESKLTGELVVKRGLESVKEVEDQPFFLMVSLVDAHSPYSIGADPTDPLSNYREGLKELDQALASLVDGLQAQGQLKNTLVVFVSDHGEGLNTPLGHEDKHGHQLFESTVGGLFVAVGPKVPVRRVPGVASSTDVAPTVLSWLDVPQVKSMTGVNQDGAHTSRRSKAYTDTWFLSSNKAASYSSSQRCVVDFTVNDGSGCGARRRPLSLEGYTKELAEIRRWRAEATSLATQQPSVRGEISVGVEQQLQALGYLDESP